MAELFNFTKYLREIVGKPLKDLGFKQKGGWFSRETPLLVEKIYFQRSQFNMQGFKSRFYLNLYYDYGKGLTGGVRLHYPNVQTCPSFACASDWQYSSEEELKQVLSVAVTEIITNALPYFSNISNVFKNKKEYNTDEKRVAEINRIGFNLSEKYNKIKYDVENI